MSYCPNINSQEFIELEQAIGKDQAYAVWLQNKGNPIDQTPEGENSKLFDDLLERTKDRSQAILYKSGAYSHKFRESNNWVQEGNEPSVEEVINHYKENVSTFTKNTHHETQESTNNDEETLEGLGEKVDTLKFNFDTRVKIDPDIPGAAQVEYEGENFKPVVSLNPDYLGRDTVFHEGGHIYIDLLGGMDSSIVREGLNMLKGSKLEEEIMNEYPELEGNSLNKEILATAVGREATDIFDNRRTTLIDRFNNWIERIFNKLKGLLGLPVNRVRQMALELTSGKLQEFATEGDFADAVQQQKKGIVETVNEQKSKSIEQLAHDAVNRVRRRLNQVSRRLNTAEKGSKEEQQRKKRLKNLLSEMNQAESDYSLIKFINSTHANMQALEEKLKGLEEKDTAEDPAINTPILGYMREQLNAYTDIVKDIKNKRDRNEKLLETFEQENVSKQLDELSEIVNRLNEKFKDYKLEHEAREIAKRGGRIQHLYREKYKEDFVKEYGHLKKKKGKEEFRKKKRDYINNQMANNRQKIWEEELQHARDILTEVSTDIISTDYWVTNMRDLNDDVIQSAVEMIDKVEYDIMRDIIEEYKDSDDLFKRFEKEKPVSNQKKKYDEIIEDRIDPKTKEVLQDSSGNKRKNNYMVGEYYSQFYEEKAKIFKKYSELKKENPKKAKEYWKNEGKVWLNKNTYKASDGNFYPTNDWKNPQFDELNKLRNSSSVIAEMYDHLVNIAEKRDKNYPDHAKLGLKLPGVDKIGMERLGQNGMYSSVKDEIRKRLGRDVSDVEEYGELTQDEQDKIKGAVKDSVRVNTDISGQEKKDVPIYFRTDLNEHEQSFDLLSISLLDYYMSMNYNRKNYILTDLQLMKELLHDRKVAKRTPLNLFKSDEHENRVYKEAGQSNSYKALESIIEDRIYGIKTLGNPQINEKLKFLKGWTENVMLIGNYLSAGATIFQGKAMSIIESAAKEFFTANDVFQAEQEYSKDILNGSLIDDFGRRRSYSKVNLINERFDTLTDWWPVAQRFANDTRFKQSFNIGTLHGFHRSAEHYIQSVTSLSVLNNIKVKDKNGKYIDSKGKSTDDRSKAMSLMEAYEVQKDENGANTGRLKLNDKVQDIEGYEGMEQKEAEFLIKRKILAINRNMYGNYDRNNQSRVERSIYGKLALSLRGWLPTGYKTRFRGISRLFPGSYGFSNKEQFYSRELDSIREGYYITASRFIRDFFRDGKKYNYNLSNQWETLNDHEKANVIRFTTELGLIVLSSVIASMLYKLGEEEPDEGDKTHYFTMAFFARRLYSELAFFISPAEPLRILRSPAASMSMLERVFHFTQQLGTDPLEVYERTDRKGEFKIKKDALDIFGFGYNQLDKDVKKSLDFLYNTY